MEANQCRVTGYIQTEEPERLNDARERGISWKKWRPDLSERQQGTVANTGRILLVDSDRVVAAK